MKVVGLMPVRNEDWVLGLSLRVALEWCDEVVVWLHACTDNSARIVNEISLENPGAITFNVADDPKWDEMAHRQAMLGVARARGATHIAMVDADEIMTGNVVNEVWGFIERLPATDILQVPLYNLRGGIRRFHADGLWGNRIVSIAFVDDPRREWGGDMFHAREPRGLPLRVWKPEWLRHGGVMHLWGANEHRLLAKHALYKMVERVRWPNKPVKDIDTMYSMCIKGARRNEAASWRFAAALPQWWELYEQRGWMQYLNLDAEPWQEAEVTRLVAEHGRERFEGLDLFGVA